MKTLKTLQIKYPSHLTSHHSNSKLHSDNSTPNQPSKPTQSFNFNGQTQMDDGAGRIETSVGGEPSSCESDRNQEP
ncbi:unnamed protein product [Camellia sinensis]